MSFCKLFVPLHYETKQQNISKERRIIHLYVKESNSHHYFGCLSAIYDYFEREQLGIAYSSLRTRKINDLGMYENRKVIIRQGYLLPKKQQNKPQKNKELKPKTTPNTTK